MAESLKANASKTEAKSEKPTVNSRGAEVTTVPDTPMAQLLQLHQTYGNLAVQRWLASGALQGQAEGTAPGESASRRVPVQLTAVTGSRPEEPLVQKQGEEEVQNRGLEEDSLQKQGEEELQTKGLAEDSLQKQGEEEVQTQGMAEESLQKQGEEEVQTQGLAEESLQKQGEEEIQTQGMAEESLQKQGEEEIQTQGMTEDSLQKQGEEEIQTQGMTEDSLQKQGEEEIQTQGMTEDNLQKQGEEEVQTHRTSGGIQFVLKNRTDSFASPEVLRTIQAERGQGEPLDSGVRFRMERSMGTDFDSVRVHRDATAARLNGALSARAFTNRDDIYFNQGQYNPASRGGQHLIAHELAHVVQQRRIPDLQFQLKDPGVRNQYELQANATADRALGQAQITAAQPALTPLAAPTVNGGAGNLQLAAESHDFASTGPIQFGFLDALTNPLEWAKEKVKPYLRQIPGYDLLAIIIGKDPLSSDPVKRDGPTIVKAVVGLIPGGAAFLENLTKTGVIAKAAAWFGEEFAKLNLGWDTIKSIFSRAIDAAKDAIPNISKAIGQAKNVFMEPINRIFNFVKTVGPKLLEFIFEGALALAGAPVKMIMGILNKGKDVLKQIITNPIGFLGNLVKAIKDGLGKFLGNIVSHLQTGLAGWLFGAMAGVGLTLPKTLDLKGIFSIITQLLGVTWKAIRGLIVKGLGPKGEQIMAAVEKSIGWVVTLITKGPLALLEQAQEFLGELKSMFFDSLITWLRNTIIGKAIIKLISMFNPVGALVQAVMTIYSTINFFIERGKQIAALASAVFNSIAEIAGGNIGKAVAAVENALVKALPVAISFLASFIGLDGIANKVKDIIMKIRKPIDKAIGKVVGVIINLAKKAWEKIATVANKLGGKLKEWWKNRKEFKTKDGEKHTIFFQGTNSNAQLMIASDPVPVFEFLKTAKANPDNREVVSKAGQAASKIIAISKQLSKLSNTPQDEAKQNKLIADQDAAINELVGVLKDLGIEEEKTNGWILLKNNLKRETGKAASFVYKQRGREILGAEVFLGQERGFIVGDAGQENKYVSSLTAAKYREEFIVLSGKASIDERIKHIKGSGEGQSNAERLIIYNLVLANAVPKINIPIIPIKDSSAPTQNEMIDYRQAMRAKIVNQYGRDLRSLDSTILHNPVLMGKVDNRTLGEIFEAWVEQYAEGIDGTEVCFVNQNGEIISKADGRVTENSILVEMKSYSAGRPQKDVRDQMRKYNSFMLNQQEGFVVKEGVKTYHKFTHIRYYFSNIEAATDWAKDLKDIFHERVSIFVGTEEQNIDELIRLKENRSGKQEVGA